MALASATLGAGPARADFDAGVEAYDEGDFTTAYNEWLPLAAGGDPFAQRNIGHLYRLGLGVPQDFAVAFNWYQRAAEQGLVRAQANLANMLLRGQGVTQSPREAAIWFHRAAVEGHVISQFNIGQMYRKGLAVPQDAAKALAWFQLAADAGHERSIELVAILAAEGVVPAPQGDLIAPPFGEATTSRAPEPAAEEPLANEAPAAGGEDQGAAAFVDEDDEDDPIAALLRQADDEPIEDGSEAVPDEAPIASVEDDAGNELADGDDAAATQNDDDATPAAEGGAEVARRADEETTPAGAAPQVSEDEGATVGDARTSPPQTAAAPDAPAGAILGGESYGAGEGVREAMPPAEDDLLAGDDLAGGDAAQERPPAAEDGSERQLAARPPAPAEPAPPRPNLAANAMAAAVEAGLQAYRNKDYTAAFRTWLPLAQAGNRDAQFFVGGLYMDGAGVTEDHVRAHAWWRLAADQGHQRAREFLEVIAAILTEAQKEEARALAEELRPRAR